MLSAFGCGAFKHPPEEVARIFRDEIYSVGGELPFIVFAIIDDHNSGKTHNPEGNYEVFNRILDNMEDYDRSSKSAAKSKKADPPNSG